MSRGRGVKRRESGADVSVRLLRYGDEGGDDWSDIIDMLTMHPEERRKVGRVLGEIDAAS